MSDTIYTGFFVRPAQREPKLAAYLYQIRLQVSIVHFFNAANRKFEYDGAKLSYALVRIFDVGLYYGTQ